MFILEGLDARNENTLRDEMLSIWRIKTFLFFLWLETKLSILDGPLTIAKFIDLVRG